MNLRDKILNNFSKFRMSLVETVLRSAVDREAHIDTRLANNPEQQNHLKNIVNGMCIIYYFAFLQENLRGSWNEIKSIRSRNRSKNINWNHFEIFKYVRDCAAHSPELEMFPYSQSNTIEFLKLMQNDPVCHITYKGGIILISDEAPFECFQLIAKILKEYLK